MASAWDEYYGRIECICGPSRDKRDMWINHGKQTIARKLTASPSFRQVKINGVEQYVSITHRTNISEKHICALPGEQLKHGGIVEFKESHWLITQLDADNEIYEKGLMQRCNYQLRWIGKDGDVKEKWCIVEDGTKYLIGEFSERIMSIGDARIAVTIGKDEDTIELNRGLRFLIDDTDVDHPLAYQITKPNRLFNVYEGEGVFKFILNEVVVTDDDNEQMRIADFYNWKPSKHTDADHEDSDITVAEIVQNAIDKSEEEPDDNKDVWL